MITNIFENIACSIDQAGMCPIDASMRGNQQLGKFCQILVVYERWSK